MMSTEKLYEIFLSSEGICTDSRKLFKGCLFFAILSLQWASSDSLSKGFLLHPPSPALVSQVLELILSKEKIVAF